MKTRDLKTFFIAILFFTTATISFYACGDSKKEDTKEVAEEHNDAKFDDNANKEADSKFLVSAAEINLEEIQLGKLAQNTSKMADVQNMGKMMEEEHSKSLADLRALAAKKQITLPATVTENGQEAYKKLSEKSGKEFDKAYCDMMVDGHKDAISQFEAASNDAKDPEVKAWAAATLPALRIHLDHAMTCQKKHEKM